jgi:hypothetical protein
MLSLVSTPPRSAARKPSPPKSPGWRHGSRPLAPAVPGGEVLLPGEIERRTRARLERDGIALDAVTRGQIAHSVRAFAVALPPGFEA